MNKTRRAFLMFLSLTVLLLRPAFSADRVAELLPDFSLPIPEESSYVEYLGIQDVAGDTFTIADIDADIVLIELFSMYCPFCQQEAPAVNELYELMKAKENSGPKVKIVGIGASNSPFEVDHFRKTFNVAFPLFPDKDMSIYNALAGAGTPGFIGIRFDGEKKGIIALRQSGGFYSAEDFLSELIDYATNQ